jgi:hypothetical protein
VTSLKSVEMAVGRVLLGGGGRRGPRDGVREREWRVAGWQWRCVCSGLTSGSGYVAVCLSAWVGHCGHFEW